MHNFRRRILHGAAAIALAAAGGLVTVEPAQAQAQSQAPRRFDIPAGSLGAAIARLGRQANVMVTVDPALVRGKRSAGLRGSYTPEQALSALLANSGLMARRDGRGGFVLSAVTAAPRRSTASRPPARRRAASPASDVPQANEVEEIIVTGEKFGRNQFNTFTSVQVVTSEELDDNVRQALDEALNNSPNIRMRENSGNSDITIRGLNAGGVGLGGSGNVISVSVDGAEQGIGAFRRGSRGTWDVEQIEVLRGPQSTLQGREALGGAVTIKSKDPTFAPELIFREEIDSDGLYSGAFAASGPILKDQVAFRLSGQVTRDDKGISFSNPQWAPLGKEKFEEFRGKLLFTPSALPGFTGLFTVSRTHDKPAFNVVSGPDYFDRKYVTGLAEEFRDTIVWRYIANLKYEFNPELIVQSFTSYVTTKADISSPPSATFFREDASSSGILSNDTRLTYGSDERSFSGVLGLYTSHTSSRGKSNIENDPFGLGFRIPFQISASRGKRTSLAIYADGRYEFTDRWTLLAGARLMRDYTSSDQKGVLLPGTPYETSLDRTESDTRTEFLPKIGLAFELSENQNIALTASKGFRPGYSQRIVGTSIIADVKPESMWAYEIAYRSKWLDDRLQINGNVFYYDYTNMMVPVPVPGALGQVFTYDINAGKSHSYGAELEARWNFDFGLKVHGALGLLKTRFDEVIYNGANLAGNEFPNAPSVTASLGANYMHQSGWFVGGDLSFTDGYYSTGGVTNLPSVAIDSFTVVNAQAGYKNEHFAFTVYAKNLLDEKYMTSVTSTGVNANIGDAQTFGLQFTQRF